MSKSVEDPLEKEVNSSNNNGLLNEEALKIDNEEEDEVDYESLDSSDMTKHHLNRINTDDNLNDVNESTNENKVLREQEQEEEEEEEEEEEGETRCICGELDPPDDSGLFIQCEQCGVWQHGYCVGIVKEDTPDKYWCEQCRPDLHRLYITDLGENKSLYKPLQGLRRQKKRLTRQSLANKRGKINQSIHSSENSLSIDTPSSSSSSQSVTTSNVNRDSLLKPQESKLSRNVSRSTRSTNKNRNKRVINEDVPTNMSTRSNDKSSIDDKDESINNNNNNNNNDTNNNDSNDNDQSSTSYDENDKRLKDRKSATFQAREEKQYQRMLERAIKESEQESKDTDTTSSKMNDQKSNNIENSSSATQIIDGKEVTKPIIESETNKPIATKSLSTLNEESDSVLDQESTKNEKSEHISDTNGSNSSKRPSMTVRRSQRSVKRVKKATIQTERATKSGRRGKSSRSQANHGTSAEGRTNNHTSKSNSEINLNKPVKPRLPPARTSLNEMRRRVSAILEFISRTQWELSQDQQTKEELIKFVENEEFIKKVNDVYDRYNETLVMMDDLTRQLLLWEQKYSFNKIEINKGEE